MGRSALVGALVFGALSALAGYVWTVAEFPFAILVPAFVGWFVVCRINRFSTASSLYAAALGGASFTVVFLLAVFLGLTDGSPLAVPAWLGAVIAAVVAGAATGALLDGRNGAFALGLFSAAGMLVAIAAMTVMRRYAPASVDVEGPVQAAYFSGAIGLVGLLMGAAIGSGVEWISEKVDVPGA